MSKRIARRALALALVCLLLGSCALGGTPERRDPPEPPLTAREKLERFLSALGPEAEPLDLDITANCVYVLDAESGRVLCEKNADRQTAPASTAKLLTALTVLGCCGPDEAVTVGEELRYLTEDGSRAWLREGDRLTVEQLLTALLLPSGNDAAYALAVYAGGKLAGTSDVPAAIDAFVAAMNDTARDLGLRDSRFRNPDGYDAEGQYVTARDLSLVALACLENETLAALMASRSRSQTWLNGREVTYWNSNALLDPESEYYYPGALGLKTGSSSGAGACLVSAAEIGGRTYLCVLLGDTEEQRYPDTLAVFRALEGLR